MKKTNVVIFNGGRGASTIIKNLISYNHINLTSIVNAYDDGKSTGEIRDFFKMLGPSDIRKVQKIMIPKNIKDYNSLIKIFDYRFKKNVKRKLLINDLNSFANGSKFITKNVTSSNVKIIKNLQKFTGIFLNELSKSESIKSKLFNFNDCSFMNCIYVGAYFSFNKDLEKAIHHISKLFNVKGNVLLNSNVNKKLVAIREDGKVLASEAQIVELRSNVRLEQIYLLNKYPNSNDFKNINIKKKKEILNRRSKIINASAQVIKAINQSNIIIYAAGTQHSSLLPTYFSKEISSSIARNKRAMKIFITNIGADFENPCYIASEYLKNAYRYLNQSIKKKYKYSELFSQVFINNPSQDTKNNYVKYDKDGFTNINTNLVVKKFELSNKPGFHNGKKIVDQIFYMYKKFKIL